MKDKGGNVIDFDKEEGKRELNYKRLLYYKNNKNRCCKRSRLRKSLML